MKALIFSFNRFCEKFLKARLSNIYYDKFYIEYYNLYQ